MHYISLLRGINVSGQKSIKMAELKQLYESLKLTNVQTYIQSGNVVFNSPKTSTELVNNITKAIKKKFGFDVHIAVLTANQLKKIADNNPFSKDTSIEGNKLHVAFLNKPPLASAIKKLEIPGPAGEELIFKKFVIYLHYANGMGTSKLSNPVLEKKLGVISTIRNWNTVQKLLQLSKGGE